MLNRTLVLEDRYTLADAGTRTVNLDFTDPCTEVEVRLDAVNGATYNKKSPLASVIDKIEIVDGSDVLYSVDGYMARGAFAGLEGFVPNCYMTEAGSDTPYESFPIRFGRYIDDPNYGLNPDAFINPQLKVTWNLANVNAVGATGYLTGNLKLSVNCKLMEDTAALKGLLVTKEIEDISGAASGDYIVRLPVDYNYRALLMRAFKTDTDIRNIITNMKLSINGDSKVPFNVSTEDLIYAWLNENHPLHSVLQVIASDATFSETWMGMSLGGNLTARTGDYIVGADYFWKGGFYGMIKDDAGSTASNVALFAHDVGALYNNVLPITFGRKNEPDTWLNKTNMSALKLYLTQGTASSSIQVAVQQERLY